MIWLDKNGNSLQNIYITYRDIYGFQEVETMPENGCVRFTLSPETRKEILKRLLALNHQRAGEQTASGAAAKSKTKRTSKPKTNDTQVDLFA